MTSTAKFMSFRLIRWAQYYVLSSLFYWAFLWISLWFSQIVNLSGVFSFLGMQWAHGFLGSAPTSFWKPLLKACNSILLLPMWWRVWSQFLSRIYSNANTALSKILLTNERIYPRWIRHPNTQSAAFNIGWNIRRDGKRTTTRIDLIVLLFEIIILFASYFRELDDDCIT